MKKFFSLLCLILFLLSPMQIKAKTTNETALNLVNIYFFHSKSCSHCRSEQKLLASLEKKYPNIQIYRFEIHEKKNNQLLTDIQNIYQIKNNGVPLTIIGDTYYMGYIPEKSSSQFIKTIEYYSRYGYQDKVGEYLRDYPLPNYSLKETDPTLKEFMNNYGNYKILGFSTDKLPSNLVAFLLGLATNLNIITLTSIFCAVLVVQKDSNSISRFINSIMFLLVFFSWHTTYFFANQLYTLIIEILVLFLFMLYLLKYHQTKRKKWLYPNFLIGLAIISQYLNNKFYANLLVINQELLSLYNLEGIDAFMYKLNYLGTILMTMLLVLFCFSWLSFKVKDYFERKKLLTSKKLTKI